MKRKRIQDSQPVAPHSPTGRDRFTVDRFLSDCGSETREFLLKQWSKGNVIRAAKVPVDGLPPVVILSAYAKEYGVSLVDDYEALLERYRDHVKEVCHPDKFLCSCILILAERFQVPSDEAFEAVNVPSIYEELLP